MHLAIRLLHSLELLNMGLSVRPVLPSTTDSVSIWPWVANEAGIRNVAAAVFNAQKQMLRSLHIRADAGHISDIDDIHCRGFCSVVFSRRHECLYVPLD